MSGASSSRIVVPLSRGGFASSRDFRTAYATDKALGDEPEYTQAPMKRTKEIGVAPLQCFRKPITASGRVPLNGSASKKFRATVRGIFKAPSEEEFERLWPKKATVVSEKLSGAGLADVDHKPMVWWIRSDENPADKNDLGSPMFIDFSGGHSDTHMFYPTVYALSIVPNLLRPMYVHSGVSTYIVRGADCMWPGVISEPDAEAGVGRFQRGERRALVAAGNPVPFAVGWLDSDSASVIAAGRTGKALSIVHCWSDELWRLGNGVAPNIGFQKGRVYGIRTVGDEAVESEEEETEAVQKTTDVLAGVQISDGINVPDSWDNGASPPPAASEVASSSEAPPSSDAAPSTIGTSESVPTSDNAVAPAGEASLPADSTDAAAEDIDGASGDDEDDEDESSENRLSPAEMDAAMLQAFLYAVHLRLKDSDFPMDPSTLLSEMQLCHFHPTERLNPKRSSFKKLAKWLKDMQKRGLLKAKTGGGMQGFCSTDVTVMSVSRTSPLLKDVVLTKEVTDMMKRKEKEQLKKHAKGASAAAAAAASSSSASSSSDARSSASAAASSSSGSKGGAGKMRILHAYRIGGKLLSTLFSPPELNDPKKLWSLSQAKAVLQQYIDEKNLDAGQGKVRLDALLYKTFFEGATDGKAPSGVDRNVWNAFVREFNPNNPATRYPEVTKSDVANRFDAMVIEYVAILPPGAEEPASGDLDPSLYKKGPLPLLEVRTEKRQGGKLLTGISGFEVYGVDPLEFSKAAAKMFACSTSTAVVPANAKHKPYIEVFIQGQVSAADIGAKLKERYGIPQQCVKQQKK